MPPPPDIVEPPILWGSEQHVREMLEPHGLELEFARETVTFEKSGVEQLVTFYEEKFGPMVMAKAALGERWPELRSDRLLFESADEAGDGSVRVAAEYLVTVGAQALAGARSRPWSLAA